jgi:hypothetical protein
MKLSNKTAKKIAGLYNTMIVAQYIMLPDLPENKAEWSEYIDRWTKNRDDAKQALIDMGIPVA